MYLVFARTLAEYPNHFLLASTIPNKQAYKLGCSIDAAQQQMTLNFELVVSNQLFSVVLATYKWLKISAPGVGRRYMWQLDLTSDWIWPRIVLVKKQEPRWVASFSSSGTHSLSSAFSGEYSRLCVCCGSFEAISSYSLCRNGGSGWARRTHWHLRFLTLIELKDGSKCRMTASYWPIGWGINDY